jgi:hypothetical protein
MDRGPVRRAWVVAVELVAPAAVVVWAAFLLWARSRQ